MTINEALAFLLIASVVGGASGSWYSGTQAWRGAVTVAGGILLTGVVMLALGVNNAILSGVSILVISSVIGGMMKLSVRQITLIILGGVAGSFVAAIGARSIGLGVIN